MECFHMYNAVLVSGFSCTAPHCLSSVSAAPSIDDMIRTQSVALGDSHKIKFGLGGTGPFTYKVYRNGQLMTDSSRFKLVDSDSSCKLVWSGEYGKTT